MSRRLRRLEKLGLVEARWARIGGRNVRVYRLAVGGVRIEFRHGRVTVSLEGAGSYNLDPSVVSDAPKPVALVGRRRELGLIRSSSAPVVHIWGPPGIGKTALARALLEDAGDAPALWYSGTPMDTPGVLAWRASAWLRLLGSEGAEAVASSGPETLAEELGRELSRLGAWLVVDDYHTLPRDTSDVLVRLALKAWSYRLVIVSRRLERRLAARPDRALTIGLGPLSPEETCELAEAVSPGSIGPVGCRDLHVATAGIPAVVVAAARLARQGGILDAARELLRMYRASVTAQLPDDEAEALALLSAVGSWLPVDVACGALSLARGRCSRILRRLEEAGLVDVMSGLVRVREHARVDKRPPSDVLARLAEILARHPSSEWRVRGISILAKLCAPREAAGAVRLRLVRGESHFLCCPELYAKSVEALWGCASGSSPYLDALYAVEYALIHTLNVQGRPADAIRVLDTYLPRLYRDRVLYTRLLALLAGLKINAGMVEDGLRDFERARKLFASLPRASRLLVEDTLQASAQLVYMTRGEPERALEAAWREAELSLEKEDIANYYVSLIHVAEIERLRGRFEESVRVVKRLRREARQTGGLHPIIGQTLAVPLVFSLLALGRLAEALREARRALGLGIRTRHTYELAAVAAVLELVSANYKEARRLAEAYLDEACGSAPPGSVESSECTVLRAVADLAGGQCSRPVKPQVKPEPGEDVLYKLLGEAWDRLCGGRRWRVVEDEAGIEGCDRCSGA